MMVPKPIEREKNACPRAAAHVFASILEKSGWNRYSSPFFDPGRVMEYMAMLRTMTKSIGIMTLLNFSIPPFIPAATMKAVTARKSV